MHYIFSESPFLSMEFFPPKVEKGLGTFFRRIEELKTLSPAFVSITCGAGGTPWRNTLEVAARLQGTLGFETMPHLTCIGSRCRDVAATLRKIEETGIRKVLALRGDLPEDGEPGACANGDFRYASDLVEFIRKEHPRLSIGVAAYPEAHPESPSVASDLRHLKEKLDKGADFVITQFFFDNRLYFDFVNRLRDMGVDKPVIPGVLPVLRMRSLKHILSISGASIPGRYYLALEEAHQQKGNEGLRRLGIERARRQIRGLLDGNAPGIHLYTLNNITATLEIAGGLFT